MRIAWVAAALLFCFGSLASSAEKIPDGRRNLEYGFLETKMQSDGKLLFIFYTTAGDHVCRVHGVAEASQTGAFIYREPDSSCVFQLSVEGDGIVTEDVGKQCQEFACGLRNEIGEIHWKLKNPEPLTDEILPDW